MYPLPLILGVLCVLLVAICCRKTANKPPPPPGPRGLPIIGNLHMLGSLPHRTLAHFSKKYGPIMSLRLGKVMTVVVSSTQAAELFLKTHDNVFASRPRTKALEYMSYGIKGFAFHQYGAYWRNVRKFCTLKLLSSKKIEGLAAMRKEELNFLVDDLKAAAAASQVVDLSEKVAELIENMTCRMLFGRCKYDKMNLNKTFDEAFELLGTFNMADYVPWLGILDLQGLTGRMIEASKTLDRILETIIEQHEQNPRGDSSPLDADFVDVLLSLANKSTEMNDDDSLRLDRTNVKAIILDMVAGAVDTSHVSILWVLSELIKNPRTMEKLQQELSNEVRRNKMVEESDLANLNYLTMVVKESLRLHPVGPLLLPRESMEDIVINGYFIPKNSRVFVNCWAIGRDPNVWSDNADEFLPERFIGSKIDLKGHDFELIPFGSGRRGCPGIYLGLTNIQIVVAQLVHCFDWTLPDGMSPADLDMTEIFALSVPRANHLLAVPTCRL